MTGQSRLIIRGDQKKHFEQRVFRMTTMRCYLDLQGKTLGPINQAEREFDILSNSLPRIDSETLNQGHDCPICDRVLNSPAETSPTSAPNPTPLQLPCSHIICGECIKPGCLKPAAVQCVATRSLVGFSREATVSPTCRHNCE